MTIPRPPLAADDPADFPDDTPAESVSKLIAQGTVTVAAVQDLRTAIDRDRRSQDRRALIKLVLFLAVLAVAVDNRLQLWHLQQQLCPIVTATITRPGEAPPVTQHGRDVEATARDLASALGCAILPR